MFVRLVASSTICIGRLSRKNTILRPYILKYSSSSFRYWLKIGFIIQAVALFVYLTFNLLVSCPRNALGFLDLLIIHGSNFSPSVEYVKTTVIWSFSCFPPLHDCLTWLKVESGNTRKKKLISSTLNTFFKSYPIIRIFKDNFHCSTCYIFFISTTTLPELRSHHLRLQVH